MVLLPGVPQTVQAILLSPARRGSSSVTCMLPSYCSRVSELAGVWITCLYGFPHHALDPASPHLACVISPPSLLLDSSSAAQCLAVHLCICFHQWLDEGAMMTVRAVTTFGFLCYSCFYWILFLSYINSENNRLSWKPLHHIECIEIWIWVDLHLFRILSLQQGGTESVPVNPACTYMSIKVQYRNTICTYWNPIHIL